MGTFWGIPIRIIVHQFVEPTRCLISDVDWDDGRCPCEGFSGGLLAKSIDCMKLKAWLALKTTF